MYSYWENKLSYHINCKGLMFLFRDYIHWCHNEPGCEIGDFRFTEGFAKLWGLCGYHAWIGGRTSDPKENIGYEKESDPVKREKQRQARIAFRFLA
jgi:hypothetical protein